MNEQLTPEQSQKISDALASGRKIEAIKAYRAATGQGLKEAKEGVEALHKTLMAQDPEKYPQVTSSGGCASVILLGVSLVWAASEIVKVVG
ncbi:ribosomal protein L7/L12 [Kiritimatiellaeota bacterium B1221]|nr:ribosomal protein L7/L12 [Kiritimatiellaeota bacterium B1221]